MTKYLYPHDHVYRIAAPLLTALVAFVPGWGVHCAEGVLSIEIATLAGTVVAALELSGAIFAKWGFKR